MYSDWEDVISSGRAFQVFGSATGKARLPTTVDRLTGGTKRRLVPVERSDRLPGRLRTGTLLEDLWQRWSELTVVAGMCEQDCRILQMKDIPKHCSNCNLAENSC